MREKTVDTDTDMEMDTVASRPVDRFVVAAERARKGHDQAKAIECYCKALRLVNRYPPAKQGLDVIAKSTFAEAIAVRDSGDLEKAIAFLVRARELNPDSSEVRAELDRQLGALPAQRDLTTECFIMPDAARAEIAYRDAIRTCLEFVAYGGVVGEILEFGMLGGWTARCFAETMLDLHYPAELYLFDPSTEEAPREKHPVDRASDDLMRGIWNEETDATSLRDQIDEPLHRHIRLALSRVISPDRLKIKRGDFSETLQKPLGRKAAIVHFGCPLYSSTQVVLDALANQQVLQDGTVLMFKGWNSNRASPHFGQRRALSEFLQKHGVRFTVSQFITYGFNACALILHDDQQAPTA